MSLSEENSAVAQVLAKRSSWTASALTKLELKNLFTLVGGNQVSVLTFKGGSPTVDYNTLVVQAVKLFGERLQFLRYEGEAVPSLNGVASRAITKHALRLVKLDFNIGQLARDEMIDLARGCSFIESLHITNSVVDDFCINTIVGYLPRLRRIDLSYSSNVSDALVRSIAARVGDRLQKINLMGCWRVTDAALRALARYSPTLKSIDLFELDGVTDQGVDKLCQSCCWLEEVDIGSCLQLTDKAFESLSKLSNLKFLSAFNSAITGVGLWKLCTRSTRLEMLDLAHCRRITCEDFVLALPDAAFRHSLIELEVAETFVTDECISNVLRKYKKLASLKLSGCSKLRSSILEVVATHLKRRGSTLSDVDLNYCENISSDDLMNMWDRVNSLTCPQTHSYMVHDRSRIRL